ncbi:hypothetical protein ACI2KR_06790 [Pseudomonas luteola]
MLIILIIPLAVILIVGYSAEHNMDFAQFVEHFDNLFWGAQPYIIAIILALWVAMILYAKFSPDEGISKGDQNADR